MPEFGTIVAKCSYPRNENGIEIKPMKGGKSHGYSKMETF